MNLSLRVSAVGIMICAALAGGCGGSGAAAGDDGQERPEVTYAGLAGQRVAVMVWADYRVRTEFSQIQVDLAKQLQARLAQKIAAQDEKRKKDGEPLTEFVDPRSVVRFQREHPEIEGLAPMEIAPRLGNSLRLIHVEMQDMQVQSPRSILLLKGMAKANLRVIEVNGGKASIALEEKDLAVTFPPGAPEGVVPTDQVNERTIYDATLATLAAKLAARFR